MLRLLLRTMMTWNATKPRSIVAVIGTTGVGKSQLAVTLAQYLQDLTSPPTSDVPRKGLILSADSMQLYKGLDVITNKVTPQEMGGVEHWGLDIVQPGQGGSWEVGRWCGEADKMVNQPFITLYLYLMRRVQLDIINIELDITYNMWWNTLLHSALPVSAFRSLIQPE
jgi:energy-coupling factor transporter ATP-binding protein EcfA2